MNRETSKFRHLFLPYCLGNGIDIGYGTDPIVKTASTFDDTSSWLPPYEDSIAYRDMTNLNFKGDARDLPFKDETLDYIYSSHTLEDFEDKESLLKEWLRVLKPGGYLLLLLPDEQQYRKFEKTLNPCHKDPEFCLAKMIILLGNRTEVISIYNRLPHKDGDYNFAIIARKK